MERRLVVDKLYRGELPGLVVLELKDRKGGISVRLDLTEGILREMKWKPEGGEVALSILKEDVGGEDFKFYAWGRVYELKEVDGSYKYYISIGGLQLLLSLKGERIRLNKGDKVYIGMKVIR